MYIYINQNIYIDINQYIYIYLIDYPSMVDKRRQRIQGLRSEPLLVGIQLTDGH